MNNATLGLRLMLGQRHVVDVDADTKTNNHVNPITNADHRRRRRR